MDHLVGARGGIGSVLSVTQVNDNRPLHIPVQKTMSWGIILFDKDYKGSSLIRGQQVRYVFAQSFGFLHHFSLSPGVAVVHSDCRTIIKS